MDLSLTSVQRHEARPDPGHLLDAASWAEVVDMAAVVHAAKIAPRAARSSYPVVDGFVAARWGGGPQVPTFGVFHDAETPLAPGYAYSISHYFSVTDTQASAHFMVGPEAAYQLRDTNLVTWNCGNGNYRSIALEQCGYVAFSRADWLTPDGQAQMHRVATLMTEIQAANGIGTYFMSDADLLRAWRGQIVGGWATHDQCRRVLGGTTHTDPMPNYPFDVLESIFNAPPPTPPEEDDVAYPFQVIRRSSNGLVVLAAPGVFYGLSNPGYLNLARTTGMCRPAGYDADVPDNVFAWMQAVYMSETNLDVAIKAELDKLVASLPSGP